jgi:transcriptional regulator with XRE-family HTH domain
MDLVRLGATYRAVRIRRGWRQEDVAREAKVSRTTVARIEQGGAGSLTLRTLDAVARALDVGLDLVGRWHGGELDRLLSAAHSALAERVATDLAGHPDWIVLPEVTFSVYGERGAIDLLAWNGARRALLVIELKTEITDVGGLVAQVDRYRRLAPGIARDRGWAPSTIACWVVVAETSTNRRRVAAHREVLARAFPVGGRAVRAWLRDPGAPMAGLSFSSYGRGGGRNRLPSGVQRVRRRATAPGERGPGRVSVESGGRKHPRPDKGRQAVE